MCKSGCGVGVSLEGDFNGLVLGLLPDCRLNLVVVYLTSVQFNLQLKFLLVHYFAPFVRRI